MSTDLHRLIYTSYATGTVTPEMLEDILATSIARNAHAGITGFLHYESGRFLQCLEGASDALDDLMTRIGRDPRHRDIDVRGPIEVEARRFSDWAMGLTDDSVFTFYDFMGADARGATFDASRMEILCDFLVELSAYARIDEPGPLARRATSLWRRLASTA